MDDKRIIELLFLRDEAALGETTVKLIVQPMVENVINHAIDETQSEALHISIHAGVTEDELIFTVADDGVGMPDEMGHLAGERDLHFGISNLRTMVERAGGAFAVLSCEEGTGTVVRARIPLTGELIAAGTIG